MAKETMKVSAGNYLVIQGWMVTELGLKGNELLIYALIYGFSQTEDQWFTGTLRYIAEWTNSTKQGVQKALASLIEKGLLEKRETVENGVKSCRYRVCNKVDGGMQQSCVGCETKLHGGMQQSCPNNIDNNNISYNRIISYTKGYFFQ